ncbi:hypothetical protein K488DRAFT_67827 [Vararia minispora EC-137]|uniref:Uncharacterized protein n=1 Tax=Vararia minispora EC-137 TaxID=1314806 RepID=A0ACB8QWK7_9AGAM|nr:hypothetical protein K488DRAFT_67827 [Vararia minispora EC-137]
MLSRLLVVTALASSILLACGLEFGRDAAEIFQKVRANGFNTVQFFVSWNLHYSSQDTSDGKGDWQTGTCRDMQRFIDEVKAAGLRLMFRSGPYLHQCEMGFSLPSLAFSSASDAGTTSGGFPGWVDRLAGDLRTESFVKDPDVDYHDDAQYIDINTGEQPLTVIVLGKSAASQWNVPVLPRDVDWGNCFSIGTNDTCEFVRFPGGADIFDKYRLEPRIWATGDLNGTTTIEFIAPSSVT